MDKTPDNDIIKAYNKTGNIWKAGKLLGICGQSVHERLVKLGIPRKNPHFSEHEKQRIREVYASGLERGDGKLDALVKELGRTKQLISRNAKRLGLTTYNRKGTPEYNKDCSERTRKWMQENEHPKGMLGKTHTEECKEKMRAGSKEYWESVTQIDLYTNAKKSHKTRIKNGTKLNMNRINASWKAQWQTIGEKKHYFRSQWEVDYANYLQALKEDRKISEWEYEPETFWFGTIKKGPRSYLPDFRITNRDGSQEYHEVKGWMDNRSETTLKRMAEYYPNIKIVLIQKTEIENIRKLTV